MVNDAFTHGYFLIRFEFDFRNFKVDSFDVGNVEDIVVFDELQNLDFFAGSGTSAGLLFSDCLIPAVFVDYSGNTDPLFRVNLTPDQDRRFEWLKLLRFRGRFLAQGFPFQFKAVCIVQQPVKYSVGQCGLVDVIVPGSDG